MQVALTWVERRRFLGVDSGGHALVLSAPDDVGVRPAEGLLLSLAGCAAYDVVAIVEKRRARLRRLSVQVEARQAERPPRAFEAIHLRFIVAADGITAEQLRRAVDLALNTYCTVRASLSPAIAVTFEAVLEGAEAEGETRRGGEGESGGT